MSEGSALVIPVMTLKCLLLYSSTSGQRDTGGQVCVVVLTSILLAVDLDVYVRERVMLPGYFISRINKMQWMLWGEHTFVEPSAKSALLYILSFYSVQIQVGKGGSLTL